MIAHLKALWGFYTVFAILIAISTAAIIYAITSTQEFEQHCHDLDPNARMVDPRGAEPFCILSDGRVAL